MRNRRPIRRFAVRCTNPEDTFFAPQLSNPFAIASEIAIAWMSQSARMSVHDAKNSHLPVALANDSTADGLTGAIELHVPGAGVA